MKRYPRPWSTLLLIGALLVPAHAFADVFLPASGSISFVGMVDNRPAVVSWTGSICQKQDLSTIPGALSASTTIWGSFAGDWVVMTDSFGDFCGFWVTPLVISGASTTLTVKGSFANDVLEGRFIEKVVLAGDENDDHVSAQASTWDRPLYGFTGNDTLIGGTASTMLGEGGNDKMCTQPFTTTFHANGGSGSNTFCGPTPFAGFVNASVNCTGCP
jgi:hypothetical protein